MHTVERSVRPGSDVAHLSLFGYDPREYYRGRGPFEAAGIDMTLKSGDVAFRGNIGTLDKNDTIIDRRAGRIGDTSSFASLINNIEIDGVTIHAKAGVGHRIAVVLRGEYLSDEITDTDPHKEEVQIRKARPKNNTRPAKKTAEIVNLLVQKANRLFAKHPINKERAVKGLPLANCLLLRGAGKITEFPYFEDKYNFKACCIAGGGLYKGIARLLGMTVLDVKGATGKPDTNITNKIKALQDNLDNFDFFFIHLKGTDTCAEDGDFEAKKEYIERADRELLPLKELVEKEKIVLVVTGDHTTSSRLRMHTADEVPILVAGSDVRQDAVDRFGERPAQAGGLGHMDGRHLMRYLMNLLGHEPLYGN